MMYSGKATKIMAGLLVVFCSFDFIAPSASLVAYAADLTWDESKKIMPPTTQGSRSAAGIVDMQAGVQDLIDELNKIPTKQAELVSAFESSVKTNPVTQEKLTVAFDGDVTTVTISMTPQSSDNGAWTSTTQTSTTSYTGRFDQESHTVTVDLPVTGTQMISEQWVIQLDNETHRILGWSKDRKNKTYNTNAQYAFDDEGWVSFMHNEVVKGTSNQTSDQSFTYVTGSQGRRVDATISTIRFQAAFKSYEYETHKFVLDDHGSVLSLTKMISGGNASKYSFNFSLKDMEQNRITYVSGPMSVEVFDSIQPGDDYLSHLPMLEILGSQKYMYQYADTTLKQYVYSIEFGKEDGAFSAKVVRFLDGKIKIVQNQADVLSGENDDTSFVTGQTGNWPDGGTYKASYVTLMTTVDGVLVTRRGINFVVSKIENGKTVTTRVFVEYPKTDVLSINNKEYTIKFDPSGMIRFDEKTTTHDLQELKDALLMEVNARIQAALEQMQILETAIFHAQEVVETTIQQILVDWNAIVGSAMDKKNALEALKSNPMLSAETAALIQTYLNELAFALDAASGQNARSIEDLFAAKRHNATAELKARLLSQQKYHTALKNHIRAINDVQSEEELGQLVVPTKNEEPFSLRLEKDPRLGMTTLIQRGEELVARAKEEIRKTPEFKELQGTMIAFAQDEIGKITTEIDSIKAGLNLAQQALAAEIRGIRDEAGSLKADVGTLRSLLTDALARQDLPADLRARIESYVSNVDAFLFAENPQGLAAMLDRLFSTMTEARLVPINSSLASATKYSDDLHVHLADIQNAVTIEELQALVKPSRLPDIMGRPIMIAPDPRADLRALILEGNEIKAILESLHTELSQRKRELNEAASAELASVEADLASLASQIQTITFVVNKALGGADQSATGGSSISISGMTQKIAELTTLSTNSGVSAATKNEILAFLTIANSFVNDSNPAGFQALLAAYAEALIHNQALTLLKDQVGAMKYREDLNLYVSNIQAAADLNALSSLTAPVRGLGVVNPVTVPADPRPALQIKMDAAGLLIDRAINEINSVPGQSPVFQFTPAPITADVTNPSAYWDAVNLQFKPIPLQVDLHAVDPQGGTINYSVEAIIYDGKSYSLSDYSGAGVFSFFNMSGVTSTTLPGHKTLYINARVTMIGETIIKVKATSAITGKSTLVDVTLNLTTTKPQDCLDMVYGECAFLRTAVDPHGFKGFVYANSNTHHGDAFGNSWPTSLVDRRFVATGWGLPGEVIFYNQSTGDPGGNVIIGNTASKIFNGSADGANAYYKAFTSTKSPMMSFFPGLIIDENGTPTEYFAGSWIGTFDGNTASGSELSALRAFMWSAASLRKDVFQKLYDSGTLMPTLVYLYKQVIAQNSGTDYKTSLDAHLNSFKSLYISQERNFTMQMMQAANALTLDTLPAIAQIQMISRPPVPVNGVDYFEVENHDRVQLDHPLSLATVMMDGDYKQTYEIDASNSYSVSGSRITEYHWNIVQGDARYVTIEKLNAAGSRVRITFYNHPPAVVTGQVWDTTPRMSNMIKVALVVKDELGNLSTPSYVTNVVKYNVTPEFDATGKLLSLTYNDHSDNYKISRRKVNGSYPTYGGFIKKDTFHYDAQGNLLEVRRYHTLNELATPAYILDPQGRIILSKDALGRVSDVAPVSYYLDGLYTVLMKPLATYTLAYTSDTDRVGRVVSFRDFYVKDSLNGWHTIAGQLIYDANGQVIRVNFFEIVGGIPTSIGYMNFTTGLGHIYDKNNAEIKLFTQKGDFNLSVFLGSNQNFMRFLADSLLPPVVVVIDPNRRI